MKDKIEKLLLARDRTAMMLARKKRLMLLVDKYGLENVALATQLNESTIKQYVQAKYPNIGLESLTQAEEILQQL